MNTQSIMQRALGEQFEQLPEALKAHYQQGRNKDVGHLDVEYPTFMQIPLSFLRLLGALVNKKGERVPTTVEKWEQGDRQHWHRTIHFNDQKSVDFKSHWVYHQSNELIEYVNPVLGLCMAVEVKGDKLYYEGKRYILKFGKVLLPIPEWLVLGHTTIVEEGVDEEHFAMDFRLTHPLFGQIFRYAGRFKTVACD